MSVSPSFGNKLTLEVLPDALKVIQERERSES
jgi:hypothetical protein